VATMTGLVQHPDGQLRLEEVPLPRLGSKPFAPHDVLCEVLFCGICGSDIHKWMAGEEEKKTVKNPPRPVVAGHEIVSVVREVGKEVSRIKPGDRVVHEIVTFYCGHCAACREGRYNICTTLKPMEGRAHYMTGGGFARYVVWPELQLHRLPDAIPSRDAVLMEPTAGSIHSVVTRMGVRAGESVAILGPGARGLLLLQVCRAVGAGPVTVTGLTRDERFRLAMAARMGAEEVINVETSDLRARIAEMTGPWTSSEKGAGCSGRAAASAAESSRASTPTRSS
jgi:threonine dehydrogenase-like Zn-dependent dehydrogenase